MPRQPNRENEKFFLELVNSGKLTIDKNGNIFNAVTKKKMNYVTNRGYIGLAVKVNKKVKHILAHRLVWLYFVGDIPEGLFINHKDGIKTNNNPENLELLSNADNIRHAHKNGLINPENIGKALKEKYENDVELRIKVSGENSKTAKLTNNQAELIRKEYKETKITQQSLANKYNVSRGCIRDVVNNYSYCYCNI